MHSPRARFSIADTISRESARLALWPTVLLAACAGPQSALDPAGPVAESLNRLGIWMYIGAAVVVLLVVVLALVPFVRRRRERPVNRALFLWGGGVALPLLTLMALIPYVFTVGRGARTASAVTRLSIDVTGHRYWWEVSYRRADERYAVATANELRLPIGEPLELVLRSNDVIHSFWVPRLAGKTDLIPGRVNRMVIQADRPGVYRGQCAEYCGTQHAFMALDVIAVSRHEFDAWLDRLAQPAHEPQTAELRQGRDLFVRLGCGACHTVRGVSAGRLGPDLTQVGARQMIGAGVLSGGMGNIAGWIASAQDIKPGIAMPSFNKLQGPQLRALTAYLGSLK